MTSTRAIKVAVLHGAVPPDAPLDERDTLVQLEAVSAALQRLGYAPETVMTAVCHGVLPLTAQTGAAPPLEQIRAAAP